MIKAIVKKLGELIEGSVNVIKIFKRSLFPFIYIRGFVWLYKDF
jgi:hypothetical protein